MQSFREWRWLVAIIILLAFLFGSASFLSLLYNLPTMDEIQSHLNIPSIRIVDRNGMLLYEMIPEKGGRHTVVPLDQIPLELKQATIATEDKDFYYHSGIDFVGLLRAVWINLRGRQTLVGGSTITQQVARNQFMELEERGERTLRRKLREMILAWKLTKELDKDTVLSIYLNQTYYGGMAYGVEAAAQTYFAKSVSELDLAESALLAGIPQAPALYNPYTNFQAAKSRQQVVLGLMEKVGYITSEQHDLAAREKLVLAETPFPIEAPHFVMMVRSTLDDIFSGQDLSSHGGLVVRTTLDLDWQKQAESSITRHLEALKFSEDGFGHNVNNAALVALQPDTGNILALVGSPDYFDEKHGGAINMAISPRQPGSALKPLVYALAVDPNQQPDPWTAATMLLDVKTSFLTNEGKAYIPENYDLREHGPVLVREALASSLNIPAVLTLDFIGLESLFDLASRLGISTLKNPELYDLSLALGGGEVRLLELTAAYGAFANTGYRVDPQMILEITNMDGNTLYTPPLKQKIRIFDPRIAWLVSDILSDNDARRIGFGSNSVLRLDRPAAVKTGTTSNFHDNWTIGYTPDLVVGVWSGNTNYEPMRDVNGLTGAAPIWHQFMRTALRNIPERKFEIPPGMIRVEICAGSGLLPTEHCPYRKWEWFLQNTQPKDFDNLYKTIVLDIRTGKIARTDTPIEYQQQHVVIDLPPKALPWAKDEGLILLSEIQEVPSENTPELNLVAPIQVLSPADGGVFIIASGVSLDSQRILLEAVGEPGLIEVKFFLDGVEIAKFSQAPYQLWWKLAPGHFEFWAVAKLSDGESIMSKKITFLVK